ncbi:MAG: biopolymer transport protein ExbB [Cryomorphaceae bacterium]|jgi:biopolymer transport protein ExbB
MKTAHKISISLAGKILGSILGLFLLTCTVNAQDTPATSSGPAPIDINVYELIKNQGGPIIYPLAIVSVVTVVMIFFFFITIRGNRVVSDRFMRNVEILIRKEDYLGLIHECNRSNESMARITENAVEFMTKNTGVSINEVREVALAEGSRQSSMLNNRISYLSDIGSISTMLGLLGTVIGMIVTFIRISQGNVDGVQQMKVAEGVYPALITTGIGLSIGIVALLFYSIFRGKVQKYISDLESASTHLMAMLAAQYGKRHTGSASRQREMGRDYLEDDEALSQRRGNREVKEGFQGHIPSKL